MKTTAFASRRALQASDEELREVVDERNLPAAHHLGGMEAEYHRPFADASDVLTLVGEGV
jgi:hypothetical protein